MDKRKRNRENSPSWKGGRTIHTSGYVLLSAPGHPTCDNKGYVPEHRLVMEKHIGRYLKKEEVIHHINNDPKDNRIENLILCANNAEHMRKYHPEAGLSSRFVKGQKRAFQSSGMLGRKQSPETRAKISMSNKGKRNSPATEFKVGHK